MKTNKITTTLTKETLQELLAESQFPCLSLYMPTHRSHPENLQNPMRFKNLIKDLEASLLLKFSKDETQDFLQPMLELTDEENFWNHTALGLAMFSSSDFLRVIHLSEATEEIAIVADSFHTKPLQQQLQSTERFQVLALSLHEVKLFEGNRHSLIEVELHAEVEEERVDALGEPLDSSQPNENAPSGAFRFIQGNRKDASEGETEHYFREVSNAVYESYSKKSGLPLVLAALPEHHHLFHKVSKNSMLMEDGIKVNPTSVSPEKLAELAWEILEPEYLRKHEELIGRYEQAKAKKLGSDAIKDVALALVEGRVEILLIEADRIIASRITNLVTGNVQNKSLDNPKVDDLLDDMSELAMRMGGQVTVLTPEQMPSETGVAAIFRY